MADHRKPLSPPSEVDTDEFAVEMIRGWIAERRLFCTLNLGHWHRHSKVDERQAWGVLLADLSRQIANELQGVTQDEPSESLRVIVDSLLSELGKDGSEREQGNVDNSDSNPGGDSATNLDAQKLR